MTKNILADAFGTSMEDAAEVNEFIEEQMNEEGPSPAQSFSESVELESDIDLIHSTADEAEANPEQVSVESLQMVMNAIIHRYGGSFQSTSMESGAEATLHTVAEMRELADRLTLANVASMEDYKLSDLWDKMGLLDRELPAFESNVKIMDRMSGQTDYRHGVQGLMTPIIQAFIVDGTWTSPSKAASGTGAVLEELMKAGNQAIDNAKKAADIAKKVDWMDEKAAAKAIKTIEQLTNPVNEVRRQDKRKIMGNRHLKVKTYRSKGAGAIHSWADIATVEASWERLHRGRRAEMFLGGSGFIYFTWGSLKKHKVDFSSLKDGLSKIASVARKVHSAKSTSIKKWEAHKELVEDLKRNMSPGPQSVAVRQAIIQMDRMGWSCIEAAFVVITRTIRELNTVLEKLQDEN